MDRRARAIIAGLSAVVVALVVALFIVAANAGDDDGMADHAMGNSYMGMMQAMGEMDSDTMLNHMREVLEQDGYQRMLQHFQDHRNGRSASGDTAVDAMMHRMMDGMMQQMPDNSGRQMPMGPAPSPTSTATR